MPDETNLTTQNPDSAVPGESAVIEDAASTPDADLCAAIESCASVLGSIISRDPRDLEARSVIDGLAAINLLDEWPLGNTEELARAQVLLRDGAADVPEALRDEYKRQFVGPGHFEAPKWASVYLDPDEVVFGNAHLELRQWMRENGVEVHDDPEAGRVPCDSADHELLLLSWLAANRPEAIAPFVANHLMTWFPRYLDLLEETSKQPFWQGYAILVRTTAQAIADNLEVTAPTRRLYH